MKRFLTSAVCLLLGVFLVLFPAERVFAEANPGNDEIRKMKKEKAAGETEKEADPEDAADSEGTSSGNEDLLGMWVATLIGYNGIRTDYSLATLQLNADGTGILTVDGKDRQITWSGAGNTFTMDNDGRHNIGTLEDGKIILTSDSSNNSLEVVFERETEETVAADSMPQPVYASSEDDFLGTWRLTRTESQAGIANLAEMAPLASTYGLSELDLSLIITRGTARLESPLIGESDPVKCRTILVNGQLHFIKEQTDLGLTAVLTESGELYIESEKDGVPERLYFVKSSSSHEPLSTAAPASSLEPASSEETDSDISLTGSGIRLEAGEYVGGESIPIGKYILSCEAGPKDYGIVSLAADTDNLAAEYPSLLYEYIDFNAKRYYFIRVKDGYILNLPFACDLVRTDRIELNNGTAMLPAGKYTFGEDLPAGKYMLVCETGENEYGTIWGQTDTDDKTVSFGSMPSIFVGSNQTKRYYINAKNDYVICNSLTCTINETETLAFEGDSIAVPAGSLRFGEDLPAGKYTLTCDTAGGDNGAVWILNETGNMVLCEYIKKNEHREFSIDAKDGYVLESPIECVITKSNLNSK